MKGSIGSLSVLGLPRMENAPAGIHCQLSIAAKKAPKNPTAALLEACRLCITLLVSLCRELVEVGLWWGEGEPTFLFRTLGIPGGSDDWESEFEFTHRWDWEKWILSEDGYDATSSISSTSAGEWSRLPQSRGAAERRLIPAAGEKIWTAESCFRNGTRVAAEEPGHVSAVIGQKAFRQNPSLESGKQLVLKLPCARITRVTVGGVTGEAMLACAFSGTSVGKYTSVYTHA